MLLVVVAFSPFSPPSVRSSSEEEGAVRLCWLFDVGAWHPRPSEWLHLLELLPRNERAAVQAQRALDG